MEFHDQIIYDLKDREGSTRKVEGKTAVKNNRDLAIIFFQLESHKKEVLSS